MGGFYPPEPEPAAAEEPAPPEPPAPEPMPPIPPIPVPVAAPKATWGAATRGREPISPEMQEAAIFAALKVSAGDQPQIQVSTKVLAEASGVPQGSTLHVLRRLADAGRIEIIPAPPAPGAKQPNTYRFIDAAAPEEAEEAPKAEEAGVAAYMADNPDLAAALKPPAPAEPVTPAPLPKAKPSGIVPQSIALRDRIVGTLAKAACTTSGLASMLDVKELSVSQTLSAMEHEGTVTPDAMPDGGRRAQLWRLAPPAEATA